METKAKNSFLGSVIVGLKLLLICAVIAGIVALVYSVTLAQYEENVQGTKNEAIAKLFDKEGLKSEKIGEGVYTVSDGGTLLGYCVELTTQGYGGDMEMMVAYDPTGKILGVSVISNSETPGIGSKAVADDYLGNFKGMTSSDEVSAVDKIGGATYSSTYVKDGINKATESLREVLSK